MATNTAEKLYLLDISDDSEFYFSNDTDDLHLEEGGFVPALCTMNGGVDSFTCWTKANTSIEDILAAENNINKWLERARERYLADRLGVYLVFERTGQELNRRARVRGGSCLKGDHSSGSRAAGSVSFTITIDHEAPEMDEAWTFKNLVANPSFEYDTDNNGLANNWTDLGTGGPTFVMGTSTNNTYHGRRNQRWDTTATANEGFYSDNIAVVNGTVYSYGLHGVTNGSGDIKLEIRNSATHAVLDTITLSNPATLTRGRDTWTASLTGNIYLAIYYTGTDGAQQNVDCVWMWIQNTYTGQQGSAADYDTGIWADYYVLNGHDDWAWDEASEAPEGVDEQNSTNRETIDIIDFQGTLPPRLEIELDYNTDDQYGVRVGLLNMADVGASFLSLQCEDGTTSHSTATIAGATGPAANNCLDANMVAAAPSRICWWTISDNSMMSMQGKTFRVLFTATRKTYTQTLQWGICTVEMRAGTPVSTHPTEFFDADLTANWETYEGPTLIFPLRASKAPIDVLPHETIIVLEGKEANNYDHYADRIILWPVDSYMELSRQTVAPVQSSSNSLLICDEGIFTMDTGTDEVYEAWPQASGTGLSNYHLEADEIRLLIHTDWLWAIGAGNENMTVDVTLKIRPRYASL